jgi:hypothetical protein
MPLIDAYLQARATLYAPVTYDAFAGDSTEELMVRHDPSPALTKRYLDGSWWGTFNFSFYAKSADMAKARAQLEAIAGVLNIETFADLFGLSEGRLTLVTRPVLVDQDKSGVTIQTSSYRLVFFKEVASWVHL